MILQSVGARFVELMRGIFVPRPTERIANWAQRKVVLGTGESGDFPGPYDPELNPLPTVLFDVYQDGEYDEAVIKKSSQSGFTLAVMILITWFSTFIGRNWMYVLDSRDEMRKVSDSRLRPMIESTGGPHIMVGEDEEAKSKGLATLFYKFRGFVGYLSGARSVGALANKSAALGVCDEADAYMIDNAPKESHPVNQVRDRMKKQNRSFFVLLSKPANEEDITHQEYLTGTRHKCYVPCPHCSEKDGKPSGFQELVWDNVKFGHCRDLLGAFDLERVMRETYYECCHCQEKIYESNKPWMIRHREWRRTNFGQDKHKPVPRKFSCEATDLYSTFPKATWAHLAVEWIDAQGNIDKIKRFLRGRLARAWQERGHEIKEGDVEKCIGEHEHEHCPVHPDLVTLCSDRQEDVYKFAKAAFRRGLYADTMWILGYGEVGTWQDLMRAANEPVIVDDWGDTPPDQRQAPIVLTGLVDEGHQTFQIRQNCLSTSYEVEGIDGPEIVQRFYPAKGRGGIQVKDVVWLSSGATQDGQPISVYHFSDDDFKSILYEEAFGKRDHVLKAIAEQYPALAPLIILPKSPKPEFVSELCQEHRVPKIVRNKLVLIWADPKGDNDYGDAVKLCLVAWYRLRNLIASVPADPSPPSERAEMSEIQRRVAALTHGPA